MFLSHQVKGNVIIISKNVKYELTDELLNLKNLWNYGVVFSLLPKVKKFSILARIY